MVKHGEEKSSWNFIESDGVPQGNVLGPVMYLLYTADLPKSVATFVDDTSILASNINGIGIKMAANGRKINS